MHPVSLLPDYILGSTPIITSGPRAPVQDSCNAKGQAGTPAERVYAGSGYKKSRQRRESSGTLQAHRWGNDDWESQKRSSHLWLSLLTLSFWRAHKEKLLPKVEIFLYGPRELENIHIGRADQSSRRNLKLSRQLTRRQEIAVSVLGKGCYSSRGRWIQVLPRPAGLLKFHHIHMAPTCLLGSRYP